MWSKLPATNRDSAGMCFDYLGQAWGRSEIQDAAQVAFYEEVQETESLTTCSMAACGG